MSEFVSAIGKINIDLLYSGIPRIPNEGEEIYSADFDLQLGGGPAATLTHLQRLGVPVRLLTFLGKDLFSQFGAAELARYQVETINLYDGDRIPVNVSSAMITHHDRTFISYSGLNEISDDILSRALCHFSGSRIVEMQPGFLRLYQQLKSQGVKLIFDMGWEEDLSFEKYWDYFQLADYYTPNLQEAQQLTQKQNAEEAIEVLADWFPHPIVKLGHKGCLIRENGKNLLIPHVQEYVAIDATGAGDAFLAGMIYGLYHQHDFRTSILFGNIMGGIAVTQVGCLSASLTEAELCQKAKQYESHIDGF